MWWVKTKNKAVDVWHTKAMLVDPRKTKLTMIWNATSDICETEENSEIRALNVEAADLDFEAAKLNFKTLESNIDKTIDFDDISENLETTKLNFEITEPEAIEARKATFSVESVENALANLADMELNSETVELDDSEILDTNETSEILENEQPNSQTKDSYVTEAQSPIQSKEDLGKMEQNLETVEPPPEALNTIASSETLTIAESNGTEAVTICETEDSNFESMPVEKEPENAMFLRVLEKTRSGWYNDKKFAKIVQKMEKGKKLKRKEFDEVYMRIRSYCQYN